MKDLLNRILLFLDDIGLHYSLETINESTFLPGIKMRCGTLVIDTEALLYPGDVLHEAGHLACMPVEIRWHMSNNLQAGDLHSGGELMAIAWSYAACLHLKIDPLEVFHDNGYKGGGAQLVQSFEQGSQMGVPLLQWNGMCYDTRTAASINAQPFPAMLSWTCEVNNYQDI